MGGSAGTNKSESSGSAQHRDEVWAPQGEALEGLYDRAGGLIDSMSGYYGNLNNRASGLDPYNDQIMQGAMGGYQDMLGGGSMGNTDDVRSQLMNSLARSSTGSNMGDMYSSIVGGEGNTYIDPMVDAMKNSSMDNLSRMQSSTGLDASKYGQSGSSRHAMQNAMLGDKANTDMLNREATMRGGAYDKDLQMKMAIAKQADSNVGGTQDRLMQMLGGADKNVQSGLGMGGGMQNIGMGSMAPSMQAGQAPWDIMSQYANILGSPTILGSGESKQSGSSKGAGAGASLTG